MIYPASHLFFYNSSSKSKTYLRFIETFMISVGCSFQDGATEPTWRGLREAAVSQEPMQTPLIKINKK